MTRSVLSIVTLSTIILTTTSVDFAGAASFQGLGFLPPGLDVNELSKASGVSADGSVVVGDNVDSTPGDSDVHGAHTYHHRCPASSRG